LKSKSFPVQSDERLLTVLRYVERNPVRAQLVARAEQRRWGSAWARRPGAVPCWLVKPRDPALPRPWLRWVNEPQTDAEFRVLRNCLCRSCPFEDNGNRASFF
jgi:putative transposase